MKPLVILGEPSARLPSIKSFFSAPSRLFILSVFICFWIASILWYYPLAISDPSSVFFSPVRGHEKRYSALREQDSLAYIADANQAAGEAPVLHTPPKNPLMCLGIATVARPGIQYISTTVGSVLEGLTEEERQQIHFVFFIAHTDPNEHPSAGQAWTKSLPDTVLTYDGLDHGKISEVKMWETERDYMAKGLFDYGYLLKTCYEKTSAPYVAILEGDVLAAKGWYHRAITAAQHIDSRDPYNGQTSSNGERADATWLYLRLFYTEHFFAWNSEEWPIFLSYSISVFLGLGITLILLRSYFPQYLSRILSSANVLLILFGFLPLTIGLYMAIGRSAIGGLSRPYPAGLQIMNNYGCCGQGFVFPRRLIPLLRQRIDERIEGYIDMLMERFAAMYNLQRWAIVPSVLQHIGGRSSKGDAYADARANMIWSYSFERWAYPQGAAGL